MALRTPLTVSPHMYIGDSTGRPLDNGMVYFGLPDQDPEYYPIPIFSDDSLTVPVTQPVRTKGGYLNDNKGDMAEIHAKELIYSVKVLDQYGRKIFYKGRSMRNNANDDVIALINESIISAGDTAQAAFDEAVAVSQAEARASLAASQAEAQAAISQSKAQAEQQVAAAIEGVAIDANLVTDALIKTVPPAGGVATTQRNLNSRTITPYDYGAIQNSVAPVSEWYTSGSASYRDYADLAAVQVDYPHVVDGTEFIAWAALQKFFDVVNSTNRAIFNLYGNFYINKELNFTGNGIVAYDKNIRVDCDCTIWDKSLNGLNYLIAFENAAYTTFTGVVRGYGAGSSSYSTRKTMDIFLVKAGCSYSTFDAFIANYAKRWGLNCLNSTTQLKFNYVKSDYCGTASSIENIPALHVTTTVTGIVNNGTANSLQSSVLTLSTPLPDTMAAFDGHMYSKTANIAYEITAISADRLQVTVRPWVDPAHVGSDWYCCIGGAVSTSGNDGSVHKFGYIDSFVCNVGYWAKSLYSAEVGTLVTQSNNIGWIAGRSMGDTTVMGYIAQMYCENDAIEVLIPNTCICTIGTYLGNINKIASYEYIGVGTYSNAAKGSLKGLTILNVGAGGKQLLLSAGSPTPTNDSTLNPHFDNTMPMMVKYRDAPTITLNESEMGAKLTGKVGYKIIAVGSGANNQPTGTWTFNPRTDSGWTVNGLTSATISGFTEPTDIVVYADYVNKNWIVKAMGLVPVKSGSKSYDPVSLATGSRTAIDTLTVTGAALGEKVALAFSRDLQGVNLEGYVSAVDIVSFYFENRTGATVDLASGTVSVKAL